MSASQVITGPHLITTKPSAITCRTCQRPILAATVGGLDRHVDPTPLTPPGELAALLEGRPTYDLSGPLADHLIRRNVHRIRAARIRPVVAEHTCRPPDRAHVDHTHLEAAVFLVQRLLGADVVTVDGSSDVPPF